MGWGEPWGRGRDRGDFQLTGGLRDLRNREPGGGAGILLVLLPFASPQAATRAQPQGTPLAMPALPLVRPSPSHRDRPAYQATEAAASDPAACHPGEAADRPGCSPVYLSA